MFEFSYCLTAAVVILLWYKKIKEIRDYDTFNGYRHRRCIDDALALGFLMKTDIEIAGITTVYREAAKRAHIVRRLLELEGRNDIPVFAGASKPLSEGARMLGVLNYGEESAEEEDDGGLAAVKFIAECAEKYGNELVLLAIGAQTNVAMAIMRYPEKMQKAGRIVVMGGCFTFAHDEWNIVCDPTAGADSAGKRT